MLSVQCHSRADIFSDGIFGDADGNEINGNDGGDSLYGFGGADTLRGGAGNDLLVGGAGADTLEGGAGTDTVSYASAFNDHPPLGGVSLTLTADQSASGFVATGGHAEGDVVSGVEKFIGTWYGDTFTLLAADATSAYELDGGLHYGGADVLRLTSAAAVATAFALDLTAGTFSIGGSTSKFSNFESIDISALTNTGGQAVIMGSSGVDNLVIGDATSGYSNDAGIGGDLGAGNDYVYLGNYEVGSASDTLNGGAGYDIVDFSARTGSGASFDFANRGFEYALGSTLDDTFISDDNANHINGGAGIDTIDYSAASSSIVAYLGAAAQGGSVASQGDYLLSIENVVGSDHADFIYGSAGNNVLEGGGGADTIVGGYGIDTVSYAGSSEGVTVDLNVILRIGLVGYGYGKGGDAAGDRLLGIENIIGSGSDDTLTGNYLANRLEGGAGDDTLIGGAGYDTYYIRSGDGNSNTITDDGGLVRFDFTASSSEKSDNDLIVRAGDGNDADTFTITDYYLNSAGYTIQQETTTGGVTTYTDYTPTAT